MKTVVLDLDGTMYRGSQIIQSAKEFIDYCLENKIPFIFLTNNAMRTRAQNVKHMLDMGYSGISSEQFFNSAWLPVHTQKNSIQSKEQCI